MQSAILDWTVSADFGNDVHIGRVEPVTSSILASFADAYAPSHTSLVEEGHSPVAAGSVIEGLLMISFPNLRQELFLEREPTFTVGFEDVMGRKTTFHFKGNASSRFLIAPKQLQQQTPPPASPPAGH